MPPISKKDVLNDDVEKAFSDLNGVINSTIGLMSTLVTQATGLSAALKGTDILQLANAEKQYNEAQKLNVQLKKELLSLEDKRLKLEVVAARAQSDLLGAENKLNKELQNKAKIEEQAVKRMAQKTSLYAQESAKLTELRNKTKDLAIQIQLTAAAMGADSKEVAKLTMQYDKNAAAVVKMDKNLRSIDAKLGQYGRNVGNYTNANYGLNTAFNQITRELPTLGMNLNTFFLAISNNIPMFADELQKLTLANEELRKSGQSSTPIWKSLVKAIFSWQTAMSVGVALLTIYGKDLVDWIGNLIKGTNATNDAEMAQKSLNDAIRQGSKDAQADIIKLRIIYNATQDVSKGREYQIKAIQKLKEEYPEYFKNMDNESILLGNAKTLYEKHSRAMLKDAQARAVYNKIVETYGKIIDKRNELDVLKKEINYEQKLSDIRAKAAKNPSGVVSGFRDFDLEKVNTIKSQIKTLTTEIDKLSSYDSLVSAFNDDKLGKEKEHIDKTLEYVREYEDAIVAMGQDEYYKSVQTTQLKYDREIADLKKKLTEEKDLIGPERDAINNLIEIKETQKWNDVLDIEEKFAKDRQKKSDEYNMIVAKNAEDEAEFMAQLDEQFAKEHSQNLKRMLRDDEAYAKAKVDVMMGAFSELGNLVNVFYDNSIQRLDEESQKIQNDYDKRLENEKLSDDQKKLLEQQRQKEQDKIDKRKKAIANKQFRIGQLFRASETIMETNVASISALKIDPSGLLASWVRLQGALALAAILAQQPPAYDKGIDKTPDTYIAGEKRPEIRIDKHGKATLVTQPTLFTNDKGSQIISGAETARILEQTKNNMILSNVKRNKDENLMLIHAINGVRKDIRNQKGNSFKIVNKSDVGLRAYKEKLRNG